MAKTSPRKSEAARRANQVIRSRTLLMMVLLGLLMPAASAASFTLLRSNIRSYWAVRVTFSVSSALSCFFSATVSEDRAVSWI